jgi:hypothetical protein
MPELQNVVINVICSFSKFKFAAHEGEVRIINFKFVYDNTASGSPLRRLVVMIFNSGCDDRDVKHMTDLPPEMVLDLYAALYKFHGPTRFDDKSKWVANYHVSTAR